MRCRLKAVVASKERTIKSVKSVYLVRLRGGVRGGLGLGYGKVRVWVWVWVGVGVRVRIRVRIRVGVAVAVGVGVKGCGKGLSVTSVYFQYSSSNHSTQQKSWKTAIGEVICSRYSSPG